MKTKLFLASFLFFGVLLSIVSCKKENNPTIPVLSTSELTSITDTSAISGGNITNSGGSTITSKGVCWGTSENPTINDNTTTEDGSSVNFTSTITGLKGGKTYYVRAYATNSIGTGYGQSIPFTTIIKTQTITLGPAYADDVYYSLSNGIVATIPRANWDIAFCVAARSSSIIINDGAGVILKVFPTSAGWNWSDAIDTAGYHSWTSLWNSDITWEDGAFSRNATGHPNYGWGVYDINTHNIDGVALYIIKLRNGSFKKIWIEKKFSVLQQFSFRYADLDGGNEQDVSDMDLSNSKANYVYYSLQDNLRVDREPDATTWDILFTKWIDNNLKYPVTGALQNIGVSAIDLTVDNTADDTYTDDQFGEDKNTIGWDWKINDPVTHLYSISINRVFIVKDKNAKVYKIIFTSFEGPSTGILAFNIKEL